MKEHKELIAAIRATLTEMPPVAVVLDTLNRSLAGSESSDTEYEQLLSEPQMQSETHSDAPCSLCIYCGINDSRPRGHTSLTGAADAQIAVKRDINGNIGVTVEFLKDGEAGETIASKLDSVEVGTDEDGDTITSCFVVEADQAIDNMVKKAQGSRPISQPCSLIYLLQ